MMNGFNTFTIAFLCFFSFFSIATGDQNLSLDEFKKTAARNFKGSLVEILPDPKVLVSQRRTILSFRINDVKNRMYVAQEICDPNKELLFPDGAQGVLVCWLGKKSSSTK